MLYFKQNESIKDSDVPSAAALGVFDGVHIGHAEVLRRAASFENNGLIPAVFTFTTESIPQKHGQNYNFIITNERKLEYLHSAGIKRILCADYDEVCGLDAERFVCSILLKKLNVKQVICGEEFHFGKGALCSVDDLRKLGVKYGFGVTAVSPVVLDGKTVSSTLIKQYLCEGKIENANKLLGRLYTINSEIVYGNQIGRTIQFPTINQNFTKGQIIPRFGVYASKTVIDNKTYTSVTNIGVKPTVTDNNIPLAETHILDFSGDLYGRTAQVSLTEFVRGETHFDSIGQLKNAILQDVAQVRRLGSISD
ncbi:MAG: bifunctional riboflavin kinase/FAD synthetase [Oscillospiraceae bacterium]|nr:bifunctional riboflavin kinase/FAD synthetase [Oscillospiraceae bacterium]